VGKTQEDNVAVVRALWAAFRSGGVEQLIHLVDEDVEWQPIGAEGAVLRGAGDLREYFSRMSSAGEDIEAIPHSFQAAGDVVVVSGTLRVRGPQGLEERTAHWVYRLRDGRLVRAAGCPSLAECERILDEERAREANGS
jgi:ketosteroid isomerase-like protein